MRIPKSVTLGILLLCLVAIGGCRNPFAEPSYRACPPETLLVSEEAFPSGATAGQILSPLPDAPLHSAGRTYSARTGIANHQIHQYARQTSAADEFRRVRPFHFSPELGSPWQTPEALAHRSTIADQYHVACGYQGETHMCQMIAQYKEYFVYFNMHIPRDSEQSLREVGHVLRAIDERMQACFDKTGSSTVSRMMNKGGSDDPTLRRLNWKS